MNNYAKLALSGLCILGMSSCTMLDDGTGTYLNYPAYASYDDSQAYRTNYYKSPNNYKYYQSYQPKQDVIVPDSYHVGDMRPPVSFKDRDQVWVSNQSPQAYTIQLADGDKASQVAQALYKAPKNERVAQVKSARDGKDYYQGVYGSYTSAAEAQKALDALPAEVKRGASVKNWSTIQH